MMDKYRLEIELSGQEFDELLIALRDHVGELTKKGEMFDGANREFFAPMVKLTKELSTRVYVSTKPVMK